MSGSHGFVTGAGVANSVASNRFESPFAGTNATVVGSTTAAVVLAGAPEAPTDVTTVVAAARVDAAVETAAAAAVDGALDATGVGSAVLPLLLAQLTTSAPVQIATRATRARGPDDVLPVMLDVRVAETD